jgi:succinylglutamate desuccinylase
MAAGVPREAPPASGWSWSPADRRRLAAQLAAFDEAGLCRHDVVSTFAYDGDEHGVHVVFGVMVHGEEVGALAGALALIEALQSGALRFGGRLTIFVGNPPAGLAGLRFREADLNRVFLDLPADHPAAGSWEHQRAQELRTVLDTAALFVDFHQTIEPTDSPFVISPWSPAIEHWVRVLQPAPSWVTRPPGEHFSAGTCCADEYVRKRGGVGFTVELSQRGFSRAAAERAHRVMARALAAVDAEQRTGQPPSPGPLPTCLHTVHKAPFSAPELALRPGLHNFQPVAAGQSLHAPGSPPVHAPLDGVLLFPKYPPRDPAGHALAPRPGELYRIVQPLSEPPAAAFAGRA